MPTYETGVPPQDWDKHIANLGGHFLQSRAWANFQTALGRQVYYSSDAGWAWMAAQRRERGINYLACSYGPVAKAQDLPKALASLKAAGTSLGVDFIRTEPTASESSKYLLGYSRIKDVQPSRTLVLDLSPSGETLKSGLSAGHRNRINGTARRGISIRLGGEADLPIFNAMLADTAKHSGVKFFGAEYFNKLVNSLGLSAKLYIAEAEGQPVCAALCFDWQSTRYYAFAAAFQEPNRRLKASVSLVWQTILDAKSAGFSKFDFWGIAPEENSEHSWRGLTEFKVGFGGQPLDYAGTWDLPLRSAKYKAYNLYLKLKGRAK